MCNIQYLQNYLFFFNQSASQSSNASIFIFSTQLINNYVKISYKNNTKNK